MLFFDFPVIFCAQGMLKNRVKTVKYTSQSFFAKLIFYFCASKNNDPRDLTLKLSMHLNTL